MAVSAAGAGAEATGTVAVGRDGFAALFFGFEAVTSSEGSWVASCATAGPKPPATTIVATLTESVFFSLMLLSLPVWPGAPVTSTTQRNVESIILAPFGRQFPINWRW
jgi:hypothetical protein